MKRHVLNLNSYLMIEHLNQEDWSNYGEETSVSDDVHHDDIQNEPDDIRETKVLVEEMMGMNVDDILVTGMHMGSGADTKYFYENIVGKSEQVEQRGLTFDTHVQYFTMYQYEDKKFIVMDVKDATEYSFIFISKGDFDFFDQIDPQETVDTSASLDTEPDVTEEIV